ncbi:DUF6343 family protein [Frankia sp. QA3]|uniref:DUF6343 family protein n=1 Tax=Frankia sp. QA3 TaxID=710111 RepID=UPI000269BAF6|nr:DUF6343 family protein [Frankia sp. QA3]EIV91117.1 hypothetical protein FraQA3DRAFT_0549 [Frankia sp. QA3]
MTSSLPRQRDQGDVLRRRRWWHRLSSGPPGAPPARSALGLRRVLAVFGLVFCAVTAGLFAARDQPAAAGVLALLALVALVDLAVIQRRLHQRSHSRRSPPRRP